MTQLLTANCASFGDQYSDARFILRLLASWLLFLGVWSIAILGSMSLGSLVFVFVGHQVNYYTGFADFPNVVHLPYAEHKTHHIFLDGLVGCMAIFVSAAVVGLTILIINAFLDHHYAIWMNQQISYIKKISTSERSMSESSEKIDDELLGSFADLDNGKRNFWNTIPEYIRLEYGFKHYMVKNIDRALPYATIRRYFAVLLADVGIVVIVTAVWILFTKFLGSFCTTDAMLIDVHGKLLPATPQFILNWVIGLMMEAFMFIIGLLCWLGIIVPSIDEWNIYQARKRASLAKKC